MSSFLLSLLLSSAFALPLQLSHQGRLMDSTSGEPLEGLHLVEVVLYENEDARTPLFQESQELTFVDGYYAMQIGADTPLDDAVLARDETWMTVRLDGGAELPRIPLASAPYARLAGHADTLSGGPVDATELRINGELVIDGAGELTIPGDGDTLAELVCPPGEGIVASGAAWICSPVLDGDTLSALSCAPGQVVIWAGAEWICADPLEDGDTLAGLACAEDEAPLWDGFAWVCHAYADADILASLSCEAGEVASFDGAAWVCAVTADADTLALLECEVGASAEWDGSEWSCGTDLVLSDIEVRAMVSDLPIDLATGTTIAGVTAATVNDLVWSNIGGKPAGFVDDTDDDSFSLISCAEGEFLLHDGAEFMCAPFVDSDSLSDLAFSCGDGEIVTYDADLLDWRCAIDQVLSGPEVLALVDGAITDLAPGATLGGEAILTVDGLGEDSLPFNGLDEVSNGLLSNQFLASYGAEGVPIPDNSPPGLDSIVSVPDVGTAETFQVTLPVSNSDVSGLTVDLTAPDGTAYALYDGALAGDRLDLSFPDPDPTLTGDLTPWVGGNPSGDWTLHIVDSAFLNNGIDGEITSWSIEFQHVSNELVGVEGALTIADSLTVDADTYVRGDLLVGGSLTIAEDTTLLGALQLDLPLELPAGSSVAGVPLEPLHETLFTRWGRSDCPVDTDLVYAGITMGGNSSQTGGISSYLCAHAEPELGDFSIGSENGARLYTTEFTTSGYGLESLEDRHDYEASCAVCIAEAALVLMIPGRWTCPAGWAEQYNGYIMSEHYANSRSAEALCVDVDPEAAGSPLNDNGALLYPTEFEGTTDYASGYADNIEVTCVVCTR